VISDFIDWTTHLNETNRLAFALVTVGVMATVGLTIAAVAELVFRALGIKTGRARHRH
jgi:hypothetical protein